MSWESELLEFGREIHSEILDQSTGGMGEGALGDFKVNVFTQTLIDYLTESGAAEGGEVCYFEKSLPRPYGSLKTNGYYLPEESDRLDLFFTDYVGTADGELTPLNSPDVENALKTSMRVFGFAQQGDLGILEESTEACDMFHAIRERAGSIRRLRVFLLTDKAAASQQAMQRALTSQLRRQQQANPSNLVLRMEVVDLTRVYRLAKRGSERDPVTVDLTDFVPGGLPCIEAPQANEAYACYLAVLPGAMLFELYEEYGQRLLQLNVRSFLQVSGAKSVNARMRETLRTEPSMFLPYNNGISATAERVEVGRSADGKPVLKAIQGIQIVNGGQTMASIHRARKADAADISDVYVQAKFSVVLNKRELEFDELVSKISQFSNSQNKVNLADFAANDPFHVEIEKLARETWAPGEQSQWFYERARGSYKVMRTRLAPTPAKKRDFELRLPPSQVFTKTDMAKYLAAWDGLPHMVSLGSQKNFVEYMSVLKEARPKKWKPDVVFFKDLVAKAIIFKHAAVVARQEGFPAYRANVVAYLVALVAEKYGERFNLGYVWSMQSVSPELDKLMRTWSHSVFEQITESANGKNVTEWCKKEKCWEGVSDLEVEIVENLPELSEGQASLADKIDEEVPSGPSLEDLDLIAAVMEVQGDAWRLIAEWGSGSGELTKAQVRLAYAMASKAAENWDKVPTVNQAKQALVILRTAKRKTSLLDMFD